jgi:glycosyltransferase involved in cell wall biosynthesis
LSLLRQDYPNFEIGAVDDNSSDNTLAIMEDIKNKNNHKTIGLPVDKLKILSLKYNLINRLARLGLQRMVICKAEEQYCFLLMLIPIMLVEI